MLPNLHSLYHIGALSARALFRGRTSVAALAISFERKPLYSRSVSTANGTSWSLTTLREKLIKIGAKVVRHARYVTFQMA